MNPPFSQHRRTTQSGRRLWQVIWIAALALLVAACGDVEPQSAPQSDDTGNAAPTVEDFGVPTPDPGQRFFEAPDGPYFDDPNITAVDPDPEERGPLILADNVYWLDDAHAHTMVEHGPKKLVFPLEGNRPILGYKPGHILINKYWMVRHYIEKIEIQGDRIVMTTRVAELEEVAAEISLFLEIKPNTPYPIAFDMLDVYLYPDRAAQEEDIRRRVIELERLRPNNLGLLGEHMKKMPQVLGEQGTIRVRQQALSCSFPPDCSTENTRDDCEDIEGCGWEDIDENSGVCNKVNESQACSNYVKDNLEEYQPLVSEQKGSGCYDAANDDASECACGWTTTEQDCVTEVCENQCGLSITSEEETTSGGAGRSGCFAFCLNTGNDPEKCNEECAVTAKVDYPISLVPPYCFAKFKRSQCTGGCQWVGGSGSSPWYNSTLQPCQKKVRPPIDLVLRPLFTLEAGVKAKVKWKIWKPKFVFTIGAYIRLGYGANLALEILETGASQGGNGRIYYSDFMNGQPLTRIPVVFWTLDVDPYLTFGFSGQAGLGGGMDWEWYKEKWFYFCIQVGTSNGIWGGQEGSGGGNTARSKCGLPSPDTAAETDEIDETRDLQAEAQVRASAGIGVEVRPSGMPKGNGLFVEPLVATIDLTASIRPPRCTWSYFIFFAGRFGLRLKLPVIGTQSVSKSIRYSGLDIYDEGIFGGSLFEMIGCGDYDPPPPYEGEMPGCATDDDCSPSNERCFLGRCVDHDNLRVSLGWNDNGVGGDQNLDVQMISPDSQMFSSAMISNAASGLTTQNMSGIEEEYNLYVDNVTLEEPTNGDYEFWVGMASGQAPNQDIPFTLEVETTGYVTTRQQFTGTVKAGGDGMSPTSFQLCAPESNDALCDNLGLCGLATATDSCGREREMDCGFCSLKPGDGSGGGWFQGGDPAAGNWEVSADYRSVHQKINGQPTMYVSAQDFLDRRMQGTFRVQSGAGDDDWIGFVFGYQAPLNASHGPNANGQYDYDAYLFAWKKGPQSGASEGFTLARVTGWDPISWSMSNTSKFEVLATDYGSGKGWQTGRDYVLELVYTADRIQISVNGNPLFDVLAQDAGVTEFQEGRFGFFNYSQADVIYSNFRADAL